jgi:hypothetical protein
MNPAHLHLLDELTASSSGSAQVEAVEGHHDRTATTVRAP